MDNIRVKQESLSDWRSQFEIEEGKKKGLDGKACWDGYKLSGTKKKGGKTVDNCVKEDQKVSEEVEGGISVENYADGVQFNEIETVDIIKAEPLNPSDWRGDLEVVGERYKYLPGGNDKNLAAPKNKKIKHGVNDVDYTLVKNDKKKETVSASHEVEGELVDENLIRGAAQGAGLLWKLGKWALPKAAKALRNKGAADISKFKKSQEIVKRVNNIEKIRTTKSLKGADVKGVFTKSKVKPELNKVNWRATVPAVTSRASTTSSRALSGGVETAKKIGGKVTKVKKQKITAKAQEILDKIKSGRKLQGRMDKAVSSSNKPGTLSQRTDDLIARVKADKGGAIVKSQKGTLATQKSRSLSKIQQKSSQIQSTSTPASKTTINVKSSEVGKGSKATQNKFKMAREWDALSKAAGATLKADKAQSRAQSAFAGFAGLTGLEAGLNVGRKLNKKPESETSPNVGGGTPVSSDDYKNLAKKQGAKVITKKPDDKSNKTISNTEKKKVNPEKNPEVIKSSPKDRSSTEDKDKADWLKKTSKSSAAKSGAFSDDQRWETQKKHRKWKSDRKKKKEVSEGVAAVASKLPWGKIAGAAMTAVGGSGVLQTVKDNILPDGDPPSDVQKELDQPQVVKRRSEGGKLLDNLLKKPTVRQRAADDAIENSKKDDAIYDASKLTGRAKADKMIEIAKKYNKKNKDKK